MIRFTPVIFMSIDEDDHVDVNRNAQRPVQFQGELFSSITRHRDIGEAEDMYPCLSQFCNDAHVVAVCCLWNVLVMTLTCQAQLCVVLRRIVLLRRQSAWHGSFFSDSRSHPACTCRVKCEVYAFSV